MRRDNRPGLRSAAAILLYAFPAFAIPAIVPMSPAQAMNTELQRGRMMSGHLFDISDTAAARHRQVQVANWADAAFQYNVVDQDLRDVFREYGRHLGIIVQLSDAVHGRAQNLHATSTAGDFLAQMAADYDLVWYFDGSVLHVAATNEVVVQPVDVGAVDLTKLQAAMQDFCVTDPRLTLRTGFNSGTVYVTGPASYVALVTRTAASLEQPHRSSVRIFRNGKVDTVSF
jgi:type III secretion protein C